MFFHIDKQTKLRLKFEYLKLFPSLIIYKILKESYVFRHFAILNQFSPMKAHTTLTVWWPAEKLPALRASNPRLLEKEAVFDLAAYTESLYVAK